MCFYFDFIIIMAYSSSSSAKGTPQRDSIPLVDYFGLIGLNPNEDFATDHNIESNGKCL